MAPLELAETWDNVGLLAGSADLEIDRVMTCLTISRKTVAEAIAEKANLLVSHHPLPFKPLNRVVASQPAGRWLWQLIRAGVAIYSPHTAWDNAEHGINAQLSSVLELQNVRPILPLRASSTSIASSLGTGRIGEFGTPISVRAIAERFRSRIFDVKPLSNAPWSRVCRRVAIVCGSGGSLMADAIQAGADLLVTGEATYHQCLDAEAHQLALLQIGHYASERFAMNHLAEQLQAAFPSLTVWSSRHESDAYYAES
jgi:GTP cyclohydrolase I